MKIREILAEGRPTLSFEVFPPKTEDNYESVEKAAREIAELRPAFMSVTYGAGGGTSEYTLKIARNIKERYGVPTLAHLTCVSSTRETVRERIAQMKQAGLDGIEAYYSTYRPADEQTVIQIAKRQGLALSGGSDFHGSNKPQIQLGTGKGNLKIPYQIWENLRQHRHSSR